MTRVKICGITQVEHALAAADAGADFLGLVFAPSKRQVDIEQAFKITEAISKLDKRPHMVGVFVNIPAVEVNTTVRYCNLDYVQISGNENWDYCRDIDFPVIKVIHITGGCTAEQIINEIETGYKSALKYEPVCLLDTKTGNNFGGTGNVFDWAVAQDAIAEYPVIVAGGLSIDNVSRLVEEIRPWGVDVSTGVETGGKKDIGKIQTFIDSVRKAEEK
ncbi:MAG: phosphoribosylanthranilate isomerase [Dehalococcoidales bacterium]|jgi:phosphoribosylanthranilate isomerase|nr:phosphoribosylanthranilate isomerase [Dehalococcoidales bacterium]